MPLIRMAQPTFDEAAKAAVIAVLDSGQLAQGDQVARLESAIAAYLGVREAVAVSSGTAALMLALLAHGVGPGDEVITTPFSFAATANAVLFTGARPVFVDVREADGCIDPELIVPAITQNTRAILPVHLYGQPCDLDALTAIAQAHGLALVEDAAQAHGARWRGAPVGGFGTGCFSFYATKNLTAGEGGILTTNREDIARVVRLLRNHGQVERYRHTVLGYNFRMTEIQGALALAGLRHLDAGNDRRRQNAAYLTARLHGVIPLQVSEAAYHVFHQYTVRVPKGRKSLIQALQDRGIESSVHYPVTIPSQPYLREYGAFGRFPVAERLANEVLSLPVHPGLTGEDLSAIVGAVNEWAKRRDILAHGASG